MEAVAALSLACNVAQLVQIGLHSVRICKQMQRDKSPAANIEEHRKSLQNISEVVKASVNRASIGGSNGNSGSTALDPTEQELLHIASKLLPVAQDLEVELRKYDPVAKISSRKKIWKGVKYQWGGKGKIDELYTSLQAFEKTMQSAILAGIRAKLANFDAKQLAALDQRTQAFAAQLSLNHMKLDEMVRNIGDVQSTMIQETEKIQVQLASGVEKTTDNIHDMFEEYRCDEAKRARYQHLLDSLKFPEMNARYNSIIPSHESTFEWVYAGRLANYDSNTTALTKSASISDLKNYSESFSHWLQSEESLFWMNGKPGSGKSTLMKFLVQHPRTLLLAQERDSSAIIISSFIFNATSYDQRTLKSVLSTLLHQLLSQRPAIAFTLLREESTLDLKREYSDWAQDTLESYLCKAIHLSHCCLYVFIDGLDEIDQEEGDGLHNLLQLIDRLRILPRIKLCVSSRPETSIKRRLESFPSLQLHLLNKHDMEIYIQDSLATVWKDASNPHLNDINLLMLANIILHKADGVFLWVRLVVSSIRNGLIKYDDWSMLLQRVDALPPKLGDLYNNMWQRLNADTEIYRAKSALYFKLILSNAKYIPSYFSIRSVSQMLLASDLDLQRSFLEDGTVIWKDALSAKSKLFENQLLSRCAGFVEIIPSSNDPFESHTPEMQFIHKSVADFLLSDGHHILHYDKTTLTEVIARSVCATFISLLPHLDREIYTWPNFSIHMNEFLKSTFLCWHTASWELKSSFLDVIEATIQRIPESKQFRFNLVSWLVKANLFEEAKNKLREGPTGFSQVEWKSLVLAHASVNWTWPNQQSSTPRKEFIELLLIEGADPNFPLPNVFLYGQTPFQCFLATVQSYLNSAERDGWKGDLPLLEQMAEVFFIYIKHGADTSVSLFLQLVTLRSQPPFLHPWFPRYDVRPRDKFVLSKEIPRISCAHFNKNGKEDGLEKEKNSMIFVKMRNAGAWMNMTFRNILNYEERLKLNFDALEAEFGLKPSWNIQAILVSYFSESEKIYSFKTIASDEESRRLLDPSQDLLQIYDNLENPEVDEKGIVPWMVEHGYLPDIVLHNKSPIGVPIDECFGLLSAPDPEEFDDSGSTHKLACSRFMQILSNLPKEKDFVQEFYLTNPKSRYNQYSI